MGKYLFIFLMVISLVVSVLIWHQYDTIQRYKGLYETELRKVDAYQIANSSLENEAREYRMTIGELYSSNDSLDKKLVSTMRELRIASNKIKNLQYELTKVTKTDTIIIHDTIFNNNVSIDTTVGDKWYNMKLKMEYPSTVIVTPSFYSEQYVYISNRKEYVGGKSKFFFINWFKKTYTVTEVKTEEKSPYIKNVRQKFIRIE